MLSAARKFFAECFRTHLVFAGRDCVSFRKMGLL
jgi:hypothetical protein